ncbi:MAG TPA: HlyD family secretion protein [Arcobacter sp.]|jgi:multidrug resistance efflux pump|nr:HlyD family secretion protein [Arcobacter sp.]
MKIVVAFLTFCAFVLANEFYSKLYPIETYKVKSSVSGKVVIINQNLEKSFVKSNQIIKIDDFVNRIDFKESKNKLSNLQEILKIQKDTYESYKKVSSKSKLERDTQRIQVLNTQTSISDLQVKLATLQDALQNKNIVLKNKYLESIEVQVGDYVNPGTHLYTAYDLSKGKLEIYLPINDVSNYTNKTIYLDGKKTNLKIGSISKVADAIHISSYKAEIIVDKPKSFSKLVKIEFK